MNDRRGQKSVNSSQTRVEKSKRRLRFQIGKKDNRGKVINAKS